MKAEIIERQGVQAKIAVDVPAHEVDKAFDGIFQTLARQVKVPGFRPGKAPRKVIEARVGKQEIAEEVRGALLQRFYPRALDELNLNPIHADSAAGIPVEGEDYHFEVNLELYPEAKLPELDSIIIDTQRERLSEALYERALEAIRREHATLVPIERPVEETDYLLVELLESGQIIPFDLENFTDEIVERFHSKRIGDEVELNWPADDAPSPAAMKVKVADIRAKEKPEIDDEFAKTLGFESWQEAEAHLRQDLQARLDYEGFAEQQAEFIDKLVEGSEVEVPASLIARQKEAMLEQIAHDLEHRGFTLEAYRNQLEAEGKLQEFERELDENAERRVRRELVLDQLLKTRGTTVSDEELDVLLESLARERKSDVARLKRELGSRGLANYRLVLARDRAVKESVRELLGEEKPEDTSEAGAGV